MSKKNRSHLRSIAPRVTFSEQTGTALYVAYGMNTNIRQMAGRCPNAKDLGLCRLGGHRLVMRGVADVVPMRSRAVECVLWEITPSDEKALDMLEGYPYTYGKKVVKVTTAQGEVVEAFVYEMTEGRRVSESPASAYYYQMLERGYAEHDIDPEQLTCAQREAIGAETLDRLAAERRAAQRRDALSRLRKRTVRIEREADDLFADLPVEWDVDDVLVDEGAAEECRLCGRAIDERTSKQTGGFCFDDAPMEAVR